MKHTQIKLACIGDSITFGYEMEDHKKWTNLLSNALNIEVINYGINGDTTAGMLSRFEQMIEKHKPTHVVITGGINDLWFGLKDELIISNIHAMSMLAIYHNIQVIIGIPTSYYNLNELNFIQENFSECVRSFKTTLTAYCIQKELVFIDFSNQLNRNHFLDDELHPNDKGQELMMENAKLVISSIL